MSKRSVLLGLLIALSSAVASAQVGVGTGVVIAPATGGDIGLLTMPTADNPRAGQFTLGLYGWLNQRVAAPFFEGDPDRIRTYRDASGESPSGSV
jgi:hypothetical protein